MIGFKKNQIQRQRHRSKCRNYVINIPWPKKCRDKLQVKDQVQKPLSQRQYSDLNAVHIGAEVSTFYLVPAQELKLALEKYLKTHPTAGQPLSLHFQA